MINGSDVTPKNELSQSRIPFKDALLLPGVLAFSFSFFFLKFTMYGFYYWLPSYLSNGLNYSSGTAANIFSLFGTGSIVGNLIMGFSTDILPWRSPVYLIGVLLSSLMTLTLTLWSNDDVKSISAIIFFLGAFINGQSIIIAAIECDIGK